MKDFLLPIGSVCESEIEDTDSAAYLIIGHRVINPDTMRAWDYIAVGFDKGFKRTFRHDGMVEYEEYIYFNHMDIAEVLHECEFSITEKVEQSEVRD